jgi:23S rRNA G2069 N7-methylase RlmK/C1962 C5-methylase RlmI
MDKRCGDFEAKTDGMDPAQVRIIRVHPDVVAEWQHTPFKDGTFDMVVFDPPQIIRSEKAKLSGMAVKYGIFYPDTWRQILREGMAELFRVLKSEGIFILKWSDSTVKVDEVLKLAPYKPMFGTRTGQSNNTHWICFIKYRKDRTLEDMSG